MILILRSFEHWISYLIPISRVISMYSNQKKQIHNLKFMSSELVVKLIQVYKLNKHYRFNEFFNIYTESKVTEFVRTRMLIMYLYFFFMSMLVILLLFFHRVYFFFVTKVQSTPAPEVVTVPAEIEAKITPETIKTEEVAPVVAEETAPAPIPTPTEETALVEEKAVPAVEDTVIEPAPEPEEEKSAPAVEETVAEEKTEDSVLAEETVGAEPEVVGKIKIFYFYKITFMICY